MIGYSRAVPIMLLLMYSFISKGQVGSPIIDFDTNYGNTGGTGMLYLNQASPQIINEGPSVGNPNLFEVPPTGGAIGSLGARELCDAPLNGGTVTEGPDMIIQINIPEGKRISCQEATYTICRRGDFGHAAEKVYVVDEDGNIISFIDSSSGGSTSDCTPGPQCVTGTISPCAINSMVADGVVFLAIHTPGGTAGAQASEVDAVCTGAAGDYNNDGTLDGNCFELTEFSYVVEQPDSAFTVDGVASELVDGMVYCPNDIIDLQPLQMNGCNQQFTVNGVDIPNGNFTLTTPGDYVICNKVGDAICELMECITVQVETPPTIEAGPNETMCAGEEWTLSGASSTPDSAYWEITSGPGGAILSDTIFTDTPELVTFMPTEAGTYILALTTISLCDTILDARTITVNGVAVDNSILYVRTCESLQADFDLSLANEMVTSATAALISYHTSSSDAQANTGALSSPYTALDGTVLIARIEDPATGCIAYAEVTLRVVPENGPTGTDKDMDGIEDGADRDDDNDGLTDEMECNTAFDLTDRSLLIGSDPTNLQIGDKVLYDDAVTVGGVVYDLVGEVTDLSLSDPAGAVSITGAGDPFDLVEPEPETDDYAVMKLSLVLNGSATAITPMGTMATIPYVYISLNDIDSDSEDYTDIAGISFATWADNTYLHSSSDLVPGSFINGGGPSGFDLYYLNPASIGDPTNWIDEGGVTGTVASTLNAIKYEFQNFSMFEMVLGVTGNTGNPSSRFSRMVISTCPDMDGDGVPNHRDLDSDNDGIPDAIEICGDIAVPLTDCLLDVSGLTEITGGGTLDCPTGLYSLSCTTPIDTDMDGTPDYLDLDSDNDGCSDSCEAGVPDGDADGIAGTGTPIVDDCGRVNGDCTIPVDEAWILDTQQFTLDIIGDCEALSASNYPSNITFQWYLNGDPIIGATNATYIPSPRDYGDYTVIATKTPTCQVTSDIVTTCCEPGIPTIGGN